MAPDPDEALQNNKWQRIVSQIVAHETAGQEELYEAFERGVRLYLGHFLPRQDVQDKIHDTFLAVVTAIRTGHLRDASRLPGFVRTIAHRQMAGLIEEAARRRSESLDPVEQLLRASSGPDPEQAVIKEQQLQLTCKLLQALPEIDRQILRRFYFEGQSPDQICRGLKINTTQFRLRKHRAKARIAELAREATKKKSGAQFLLRKSATAGHLMVGG